MKFVYTDELKAYMNKKNYRHILIEAYQSRSCTGCTELSARFLTLKTAGRVKEKGCQIISGELGEVLIPSKTLTIDDTVTLGLGRFLCIRTVTVDGIHV